MVGLLSIAALSTTARGEDKNLDRVLGHLRQHQEGAKVVRIRAEGKRLIPKGGYTEHDGPTAQNQPIRPAEDEVTELKQDMLLDFSGNRYRLAYQEVRNGKLESWLQAFDGKKAYGSKIDMPIDQTNSIRPSRMSIYSGGDHIQFFHSAWWPYFQSQGILLTNWKRPYYWHAFRPSIDAENLFVHRQETIGGRTYDVLRTFPVGIEPQTGYLEYAIDQADGSVRRMTEWVRGKKATEIVIDYRTVDGRRIPAKWTNVWLVQQSQKPWRTETMAVTAVEYPQTVEDAQFRLVPANGTIVKEQQYPNGPITDWEQINVEKTKTYQADQSGHLIEGEVVNGEFRPRRTWLWWLFGMLTLLTSCGGWFAYRKVRSRQSLVAGSGPSISEGHDEEVSGTNGR